MASKEWIRQREDDFWTVPRYWRDSRWNDGDYPVVGVSWYEAIAFCQWLSEACGEEIQLPTEQQWQRAAQGDDHRIYPWGNNPLTEQLGNWNKNVGHTTPVTQYSAGASPYGVINMSGNVWEWCLTVYESGSTDLDETNSRVLRGGSWSDHWRFVPCSTRNSNPPDIRSNLIGFRIARPTFDNSSSL